METVNIFTAFTLTLLAGLAMGVGSILSFVGRKNNKKFLSVSLGFASGVMIYVAFTEIFIDAKESLIEVFGESRGSIAAVLSFFFGMIFMVVAEKFCFGHTDEKDEESNKTMYRMGITTALAIGIHNFPEGIAIFTSVLKNPTLGFSVAVAIAIHNISAGIAISAPIYYATGNRKKAFLFSLASGIVEPAGALISYIIFKDFIDDKIFGLLLSAVAGIMGYIALDELLPSAQKNGNHHTAIKSMIAGMAVMAISTLII